MEFILLALGISACILVLLHFKTRYSYVYRSIEKMYSGPRILPILGNTLEFFCFGAEDVYNKLQQICNKYPRFTRMWIGSSPYIIIYEARDVEVLLSSTTQIKKSNFYRFLYDWIGTGLLTSEGEKWKSHRKIITPAFHFKILDDFIHVFNSNGSLLIEALSERAGKGTFNVYHLINLYALDNICETALGVHINAQKNSESQYAKAVKDICNVVNQRSFKLWLASDIILNMSKYGPIYKRALNELHTTTEYLIQSRKKELQSYNKSSSVEGKTEESLCAKKRLAFLDLLILTETLSDQDIREEVDTFMFEGHDTVTSGIGFVLYVLAHNQEVQEQTYKEQLEIFDKSDTDPTPQDLHNMKYLEMVIKESQRLYPSVPLFGRTIMEDLHLNDGYFLPKGSYCTVNVVKLHRDPKVWPNPHQFNTDNFLPDAVRARNPYSYVPFSAGPRNCIGQRFAMMEMKCCVSKILRKFRVNPSRDQNSNAKVVGALVLLSTNGINLEFEYRM